MANAIQPVAVDEARIAATNMCGGSAAMAGELAMNVLDTVGLVASSFGQWAGVPAGEGGARWSPRRRGTFRYMRLEFRTTC